MNIAAAYVRVSDERQDEYSPDSQLKLIRQFAEQNGYYVEDKYIFYDDGVSAKSVKGRDSFNEMISLAEKKNPPFKAIIVWKFSRFSRNTEDSILLKARLKRNGVSVLSVSERLNENDEYSELIERFIEWDDAHYLKRLSQEVRRGMLEKASGGEAMSKPFGYDIKNKQLIPNQDADTVIDIYQSFSQGESIRSVAQRLAYEGILTRKGNPPDSRFIEYILNNPVYMGKIRWSNQGRAASERNYESENIVIFDGRHKPIIDEDLWRRVQERLKTQKEAHRKYSRREQSAEWMLKGLVRCSSCNATLTLSSCTCPSMQCHNYARGKCKTSHSLSVAKANELVIQAIQSVDLDINFIITAPCPENVNRTNYVKAIENERRKLKKAKEAYLSGIDTLDEYRSIKQLILQRISSLEAERDKVSEAVEKQIKKADSLPESLSLTELLTDSRYSEKLKNEALRCVLKEIIYDKANGRLKLYFY